MAPRSTKEANRLNEARDFAELWLERVRLENRLPAGAAALLVLQHMPLQDLDPREEAERLLGATA